MCRVLGVSRSGYYAWARRVESLRKRRDEQLLKEIRGIYQKSRGLYGSPRVHAELKKRGISVGRKRVARLMADNDIRARRRKPYCRTTDSSHGFEVAPNLIKRSFRVDRANSVWVSDITYVWTHEGYLYLAVIIDLFSRMVIGWAMEEHMRTELVLKALDMALTRRIPSPSLIHHSDRGSQYASAAYREALKRAGIECSMSKRGDCFDNAVVESFFSTLKKELLYLCNLKTRESVKIAIHDYIEAYYNRKRSHSYLGYLSPADFERLAKEKPTVAA